MRDRHHRGPVAEHLDDVFAVLGHRDHVISWLDDEHLGLAGLPPHLDRRLRVGSALHHCDHPVPPVEPHRRIVPRREERRPHRGEMLLVGQFDVEHLSQPSGRCIGRRDPATARQEDHRLDEVGAPCRGHPGDPVAEGVTDDGR